MDSVKVKTAYFNPHPRVGGDIGLREVRKGGRDISIHTPAWGVTALVTGITALV